jgi:hypothetical protein
MAAVATAPKAMAVRIVAVRALLEAPHFTACPCYFLFIAPPTPLSHNFCTTWPLYFKYFAFSSKVPFSPAIFQFFRRLVVTVPVYISSEGIEPIFAFGTLSALLFPPDGDRRGVIATSAKTLFIKEGELIPRGSSGEGRDEKKAQDQLPEVEQRDPSELE